MADTNSHKHLFPKADANCQPTPWWYFGRAVYVSRRDYWSIFKVFAGVGAILAVLGVLTRRRNPLQGSFALAQVGFGMLGYSLVGLYRMYGHPAVNYFRRLIEMGEVEGPVSVADLHIGTYRHSYLLAELLPQATIHSIDCWNVEGPPAEEAVQDVRELEPAPTHHPRIHPAKADHFKIPLKDESCDVVVMGFGTHEIPTDGPRQTLFKEAQRILKPGGKALLFEHGKDPHNFVIFGPVIKHVTRRDEWEQVMNEYFGDVRVGRTSHAVDLFAGVKK